jgi:hypothetical protein
MSQSLTIERRLSQVERDIADLKSQVKHLRPKKENWIDQITGTFQDDPEFEEILRIGSEIRQADRPKGEGE